MLPYTNAHSFLFGGVPVARATVLVSLLSIEKEFSSMKSEKVFRILAWVFLGVGLVGTALVEAEARSQSNNYALPIILIGIGLSGFAFSEIARRKITPKKVMVEEKKAREEWLRRSVFVEMDIQVFVWITGVVAELFSFGLLEYRIIAVVIYLTGSYAIYVRTRRRIQTFQWVAIFHFAVVFAIPMSAFAWQNPELLAGIGITDAHLGSEISLLTFLYLQMSLFLTTILTASHSWRTQFLIKKKLSIKNLQFRQRDLLVAVRLDDERERMREILSDVATLRESLIRGDFETTIALGWSITDRLLSGLSKKETMRERAAELGLLTDNFNKCYKVRNDTVHAGYKPSFDDGVSLLELIEEMASDLRNRFSQGSSP